MMSNLKYVSAYLTTEFNIMVFMIRQQGTITFPFKLLL